MSSDRLTDSLDRPWVPGTLLGRGTWGRSRIVRDPQGREAVLKEPLTEADFPADAPRPDEVLAACRTCARQQADLLHEGGDPFLPRLESTVELGGGRVGLILPRYSTLQRRIERGMALGDVLALVHRIASSLADTGRVHGNLRPSNIVFGERDVPFLADQATPALAPHHVRLMELADARHWMPPEAKSRPTSRWDTWALCQILHGATLVEPAVLVGAPGRERESLTDERAAPLPLARGGLDKVALATLKDAAHAKLTAEDSNPRFRGRVTDRLGALLSRGLSSSWEPSPPYRFSTARDLAERVSEILALLAPRVVEVGRLLLPAAAVDGVFQSGAELALSCTVGCTQGITDHEDLVCGLQLVDLDASGDQRRPVEDTKIVVQVHPSGRLRFQLVLPAVPPGRYRVRVAFAVKDSGHDPQVVSGEFEVRPPPGYVPPRLEPERGAIAFPGVPARDGAPARDATSPPRDPPTRTSDPGSTAGTPSTADRKSPSAAERARPARTPAADAPSRVTPPPSAGDPSSAGNVVSGPFPRPLAPPQEDFDLAETPRVPRKRRPEPLTDATLPEPNVWPPIGLAEAARRTDGRPSVDEPVTLPPDRPADGPRSRPSGPDPTPSWLPAHDLEHPPRHATPVSHGGGVQGGSTGPGPGRVEPSLDDPYIAPPALIDTDAGYSSPGEGFRQEGRPSLSPPPRQSDPRSVPSSAGSVRPHPPDVRPLPPRPTELRPPTPRVTPVTPRPVTPRPVTPYAHAAPVANEELPTVSPAHPPGPWVRSAILARVVDAIRRDSYVAVGAAVAASLVLVLLTSALLKAC